MFRLLLLVLAFLAAPLRAETIHLPFGGLDRQFDLTIPDGLTRPAPLVLVLHGVLERPGSLQRISQGQFDRFAREFGYVVAYPVAYKMVWDQPGAPGAQYIKPPRDDVAFVAQVIDAVRERVAIDRDRIFAVGFSQGGMVSYALACQRPGLVRAIATLSMPLPAFLAPACRANPPDGVLVLHGDDDRLVPFDGGGVVRWSSSAAQIMPVMSHAATVRFFTRALGCGAPTDSRVYDAKDDGTRVLRTSWSNCGGGAVEDYVIEGGGHAWPGGTGPFQALNSPSHEIDGAATAIGFFSRFR